MSTTSHFPGSEQNENEFPTHSPPLPSAPSRSPLHTIPDPSQNPRDPQDTTTAESDSRPNFKGTRLKKIESSTYATPKGGTIIRGPSSAQSTPTRSVGKASNGGGGIGCRQTKDARGGGNSSKVFRGILSGVIEGVTDVPHFELVEDPSFWMDHNVQVLVRIRPINSSERALQGNTRCLRQDNSQTLTWLGHPETRFTFDNVACETISQEKLFKVTGLPMVENCMSGYNSCMFAYGQTGSGKTYTMMGEIHEMDGKLNEDCGMTPRIFEYLFTRIRAEEECRSDEKLKYSCKCSFLEIYNEHITDLLEPSSTNLQIREDMRKGVYVENLTEYEVITVKDVLQLLQKGATNRKMAATNMNSESSRSHSVFTCIIESQWDIDSMTHFRFGRLNLVDLAGSERQKSSGAEGERLKEAANINKSLSTLGLVINTLVVVAHGKHRHVPYRDSRLTFLLQDSLGGNSKTTIIANISPSTCSANESLSTLKFAQRAKLIQNNAKVNEDASGDVTALQRQIQQLKGQLNFLVKHQNYSSSLSSSLPNFVKSQFGDINEIDESSLDERISDHLNNRSIPQKKIRHIKATLVGALRREKMAETAVGKLEAEIKHMDRLVHQQEEDAQRTKMILRFHEEKIKRLEMLSDGLVSADEYLMEENSALSEEIQLLQEKIDRNPELTRFALENLRLLEQLRMYQDFCEQGEREMMLAEISELRDQLKETLEGKLKSPSHKANQVETVSVRSDSEDEIASHSHLQVKVNEKMDHVLALQASGAQKELIEAWTLIEGLEQQQVYLMEKLDILKKKNFQYEEILKKKDFEESQSQLILGEESNSSGKHHKTEDPVQPNVGLLMEGSGNFITSGLQAKLDRLNRELKEARIMNQQYHDDCASQIFHQNEVEQVREQVEVETAKTILHLQEELTTLQQEFKDELFIMTKENIKLTNTIEAREEEIRMLTEEWEKAMLELTGFLTDGCRSLVDASDHIESIARSLPEREVWIGKHVERAVKIFVEKEKTIKQLQKSLEEAQEMCMELKLKLSSLQGATLALTEVRQLENDENTREVMELQTLLWEKTSKIKELESKLESMEDQIIEAGQSLELVEEGEAGCSNTREMLHLSLDDARFIFDEKFKINNSFLSKFEEAHSTLEEADLMLNALLKANENAKLMTDTWKRAGEELMIERVGLIEEVQQLKSSIFQKEGVYESMQDHMHAGLVEIAEMVSSLEVSFVQMKRDVEDRFRIVYSDISSLGQDLLHCICNSRASVEDIWSEMVENGFALFVLCQCYAGQSFKKISFDKSGPSLFQHRQQKCYSIVNDVKKGCTSAREKCIIEENSENMQYELSNPRANLELQNQYEMVHNLKEEELSMSPSNMSSENLLLKKELARKDDILKGLLFDISLLQESASNSKDIKDETEQMFTALTRAQHELLLKTTQFDDIVLRHRQLEEMLMNSETALSISNSELGKAKETIDIFTKQNFELRAILKDLHVKQTNTEEQLEEQKEIVKSLEKENLRIAFSVEERILSSLEKVEDELRRVTEERDHLLEEVATMNDKLEMAHALADENEAIAVEARHESEASKVYAEQKEEEAKILERSVEELEHTINVLERKVYEMGEEVQRHHLMRDDVELELKDLRLRMLTVQNFTQIFNPENSDVEQKSGECEELTKHIRIIEKERVDQAREIKECRKYISELVLHAEAQASQYQQKYKMLEDMVHEMKRDPSASTSAPSTLDKTEKGSTRTRGSSSPFRCITSLVQQMNLEKDQELSIARLRIEELEALACSRQKEVCMLNARLAAADNMTHDVIRDLLGVKLDMTNYANLIDQHQVQELVEGAQRQTEEYIAKEQEILQLRKQINDLVEERQSCIEELNQRESDILAAQLTLEQHKQRDQMLKAQNEMLKMDKTNLKRKIAEMDEMLKNHCGAHRFKQPMQQPGKMKENGPLRTSNNEFGKSLTHSEKRLSRVNEELAWFCQSNSRDRYEVEEQRLRNKRQGAQECEDQ